MNLSVRTGVAGVLCSLAVVPAAHAVDVTVRVEGGSATLVAPTVVEPTSSVVVDKTATGGTTCDGAKGGGALELATDGDWGGSASSFGGGAPTQAVEIIMGESHPFSDSSKYWAFDVNNSPAATGICEYEPQQGDEILFYVACLEAGATGCASLDPLDVRAPAQAAPGVAVTISVDEYTSPFGEPATAAPSSGATVSSGGQTATTGAAGTAKLTLTERGPNVIRVSKEGRVRDQATICVTDKTDGFCGYEIPADTAAPVSRITNIEEGQVFKRGKGPRRLKGRVTDPSGLKSVKLALTRRRGPRCAALKGDSERFRKVKCGRHPRFGIGDRGKFSYLLPKRLGAGKYVFDVVSTDKAGNREGLFRGRNRVTFTVR